MAAGDEGRMAGHHCTPGRGWRWQQFGNRLMLVTDGGGADVVLSFPAPTGPRPLGAVMTCDSSGLLVPFRPDSPLGRLLESVGGLVDVARYIEQRDDRPNYLPRLRAALANAGLL